jgi:hypothetical protein
VAYYNHNYYSDRIIILPVVLYGCETWSLTLKIDLQEVRRGHGDWMELAQDRERWRALVGTVRDFRVP